MGELVWRVEGGREWIEDGGALIAWVEMGNAVEGTPSGCRGLQPPPPLGTGEGKEETPSGLGDLERAAGSRLPLWEGAGEGKYEVVCWSGWVGDARVGDGWFERSVGAWMPQGVAQRERVIGELVDAGVVIRPHARHLVSDIPACLNLLRERPGVKLLVDVAGFFEPSMIGDATVHLERIIGGLGGAAWGVVLSDVVVKRAAGSRPPLVSGSAGGSRTPLAGESGEEWCIPVRPGAGVLDMGRLRGLVRECCGDGVRIIERL